MNSRRPHRRDRRARRDARRRRHVAQAPGIKRTILQRIDVGNNMEVVLGIAEIAPGGSTGRHTHFGVETGYVLAGTASLEIEGEAPQLLNAGDSYVIPAGKVHDAKTVGDAPGEGARDLRGREGQAARHAGALS